MVASIGSDFLRRHPAGEYLRGGAEHMPSCRVCGEGSLTYLNPRRTLRRSWRDGRDEPRAALRSAATAWLTAMPRAA